MTFSVLGIDTAQVIEIDPRTGKERPFYVPKINPQTGKEKRVELAQAARRQGTYILGATGTGKSALILNMVMQDIKQGKGVAVLDPHSDLVNSILARLDEKDLDRVVLLDPLDETHFFGLNLYACADPSNDILVQGTYEQVEHIFDVLWLGESEDQFGPQVREGLLYSSYALIYNSGTSYKGCGMLEIPLLFQEGTPRANMVKQIQDPVIRSYWEKRYEESFDRNEKARRADMVVNKLNEFIANPIFRRIVGQGTTTIDFHDVVENGKILLVKLPGRFERMSQILGAIVIAQLLGASYEREKQHKRPQFNIYADEFQRFATRDFAKLLTEASRKYNTPVTIAHQARDFIDLKNKAASLQVANLIVLRIIRKDADEIAGNFDSRSIRTKKVLRQKTEPIYRERPEWYWEPKEAEKQAKELQERVAEAKRNAEDAPRKRKQMYLRAICAWALAQHFRNAFRVKSYAENVWCNHYSLRELLEKVKTEPDTKKRELILTYLYHPFAPCWFELNGEIKDWDFWLSFWELFWGKPRAVSREASLRMLELDGTYHLIESNLTLDAAESETANGSFYAWPDWHWGKTREKDKKLISYTYRKRIEWYTCTGYAAISGLEYALRHTAWPENIAVERRHNIALQKYRARGEEPHSSLFQRDWNDKFSYDLTDTHPLFDKLLEEFIQEIHTSLLHIYEGVRLKFIPNLTPYIETHNMGRLPSDRQGGWSPLTWPTLAEKTPPEIGQRWTIPTWIEYGRWEMERKPEFEDWLMRMVTRLEALIQECETQAEQADQWEKQSNQQLAQLTKEWDAFQNQHHKVIYHQEYAGERPIVEEKTRYSTTHTVGESEHLSVSRLGSEQWLPGKSSSDSTTISTSETQIYEWIEEPVQTPEQRRDEIAGEIALLPDYVARVRIKDEKDELVEYTIRTIAPERGLPEKALNERIARIKATMIEQNIIRPKHVVDEEIRKRQQALRQPTLKPPHKQGELPPPEDEPPITRRG